MCRNTVKTLYINIVYMAFSYLCRHYINTNFTLEFIHRGKLIYATSLFFYSRRAKCIFQPSPLWSAQCQY